MRKTYLPVAPAVALLTVLVLVAPAGAIPATLQNTGDTYVVTQAPDQTTNYGLRDHIYMDTSGYQLGLVRFDNLPINIETLNSATLNLYKRTTSLDTNPIYIDVHSVTDPVQWAEGADDGLSPPTAGGATWLHADYPTAWTSVPFNYGPSLDQQEVIAGDNALDVTGAVQEWLDGQNNNGLMLQLSGGSGSNANTWYSKESVVGLGAHLLLDYDPWPDEAVIATVPVTRDAPIFSSQSDANFGLADYSTADSTGTSRTLIAFDNLPDDIMDVFSAKLRMKKEVEQGPQAQQWGIHEITESNVWVEGNSAYQNPALSGGATWNDYDYPADWDAAGSQHLADAEDIRGQVGVGNWNQWDITGLVQKWIDRAAPNNGVLLKYDSGDPAETGPENKWWSKDAANQTDRPYLALVYNPIPEDATKITLESTGDTYVSGATSGEQLLNHGGEDTILMDSAGDAHGLIRFDNLPGDIDTVVRARLIMEKAGTELSPTEPIYIDAHAVTDPVQWAQGSELGADPLGPNGGATWLEADAPTSWGSVPLAYGPSEAQEEVTSGNTILDITVLVQDWADGLVTNNGIHLLLSSLDPASYVNTWYSSESTEGTGPQLELVYFSTDILTPKNRGDVNEDGFVGADDLVTILTYWGQSGVTWSKGDIIPYNDGIDTGDDFVGADDYVEVLTFWGTSYDTGEPIPEPATLALIILGGALALLPSRR